MRIIGARLARRGWSMHRPGLHRLRHSNRVVCVVSSISRQRSYRVLGRAYNWMQATKARRPLWCPPRPPKASQQCTLDRSEPVKRTEMDWCARDRPEPVQRQLTSLSKPMPIVHVKRAAKPPPPPEEREKNARRRRTLSLNNAVSTHPALRA